MPIDSALEADIFAQLGGKPDPAASDTEETDAPADPADSPVDSGAPEAAAEEETAADEGAETDQKDDATESEEIADETEAGTEDDAEAAAEAAPAAPAAKADDLPAGLKKELFNLREEIRQLRAQATTAPAATARAQLPAEAEVLQASSPAELAALRQKFEELEDLATAHADGYEVPGKKEGDEPTIYTREQMAQIRVNARKALRLIPARAQSLQVTLQHEAAAHQFYTGFNDPESDESRAAQFIVQTVPELRRLPSWKQIIGDAIVGERLRLAKASAAAAPNAKNGQTLPGKPAATAVRRPPATVPGAPHRAPSAPPPRAQQIKNARVRASKTGSEADVASLLELSLGR